MWLRVVQPLHWRPLMTKTTTFLSALLWLSASGVAADENGLTCAGEVSVCVPLSKGGTCADGGALHDSTL